MRSDFFVLCEINVVGIVRDMSCITHSVLGAPVNSTYYIKKIVNCTLKQSGKVPHRVL